MIASPKARRLAVPALVAAVPLLLGLTSAARAVPPDADDGRGPDQQFSFAVIGDVPYGAAAEEHFPTFISGINDDPDVRQVTHLGDIKSGSTTCDDQRFGLVRQDFDLFADPLYYTPGDNEWTDCHRTNNGSYQPLERLAKVRELFFTPAGSTLGAVQPVQSQASLGFPENMRWTRGGLSFATLHVVGSNDDLAPWTGLGNTTTTPQQVAEEHARMDAALANLHAAVTTARQQHSGAVVLMQQADMFDGTVADPQISDYSAFKPLVQALVEESRRFGRPIYLFNGDSHRFTQDQPLAPGSRWLDFYGVHGSAPDLHRITVDGSDLGEADWLKVTALDHGSKPLTVERIPGR